MRSVSIIISTCNRSAALEKTLRAFAGVNIPAGWNAELVLVDNASQDQTPEVIKAARLKNLEVRYLREERIGKSNALNTGLAAAQGEALLFTDDDVVPAHDWGEKLATPLLEGECEGVGGRIKLADEVLRPWMESEHRAALSDSGELEGEVKELIGANMGLHRSVFDRIPKFDPELGPGASGFGEETLLAWQMREAGLRLKWVPEALIVHHPDAGRLRRADWIKNARKRGCSKAYLLHHWEHVELKRPQVRYWQLMVKWRLRRMLQTTPAWDEEGCPLWEISYIAEMEKCRQFLRERQRPRNYSRRGLRKIAGPISNAGSLFQAQPASQKIGSPLV